MTRITFKELMRRAVQERNVAAAERVADICRFRYGMNYDQTLDLVNAFFPICRARWDVLLYAADEKNYDAIV